MFGTCGFCGETVPLANLMEHLRGHGMSDEELEFEEWPDGEPVIFEDLKPEDFGA